jgi:hypothetical protein
VKALKAPVMLGLFLSMITPIYCEDYREEPSFRFDGQGGWLWADEDGDIFFRRQSIGVEQAGFWRLAFEEKKVSADHQLLQADGSAFFFEGGIRAPHGGIDAVLGFYSHGNMELLWDGQRFENSGGEASSFSLSLPVYFNQSSLVFSYTRAEASLQDGSFYWFLGRPRLDDFHLGGLSFAFGKRQRVEFEALFLEGGILSPEDVSLFDFSLRGFHASYSFQKDFSFLGLGGDFGVVYGKAQFDGSLTASNQHYTLFPYLVYETSGQISAFAGYGMVTLDYRARFFSLTAQFGVIQVFYSNSDAEVHYKQKTLFGGKERRYNFTPIDIGRPGCALVRLDAALLLPDSKTKPHFAIGIKKLFFIPWNYQRLISPDGGGDEKQGTGLAAAISPDLLKSALLSGLSLYFSFGY